MKFLYDIVSAEDLRRRRSSDIIEYWLILHGSGDLRLPDGVYPLRNGDLLLLPAGWQYRLEAALLGVGRIRLLPEANTKANKAVHITGNRCGTIFTLFSLALQLQDMSLPHKDQIQSLLDNLVFELQVALDVSQNGIDQKVLPVIEEIFSHLSDPSFDLSAAISKTNYNPNYFNRLFHQETGMAPNQFLIQQRINRSKELMQSSATPVPVKKLAEECGFSSPVYYARQFRQREGVSPTAYWKQLQKEPK